MKKDPTLILMNFLSFMFIFLSVSGLVAFYDFETRLIYILGSIGSAIMFNTITRIEFK